MVTDQQVLDKVKEETGGYFYLDTSLEYLIKEYASAGEIRYNLALNTFSKSDTISDEERSKLMDEYWWRLLELKTRINLFSNKK